ncbi:hypothetical protein G7046_g6023 [Stylonectria norvegica]|nr:hypothetical protein G7046_g6023 [Stylonectria norvegica]
MRFFSIFATLSLGAVVNARSGVYTGGTDKKFVTKTPEGIDLTVFKHAATSSSLEYVTNSGICETTPGVNQYSGYISVGQNMSMWFWFFEARHNPETAPVSIWLNGGPGCSSMIGLFQENGPCHFVNNETEPSLNPHSWNEYANMLYIDQPIGTGFSTGTYAVNSTIQAAPYIWNLLQAFFANFPQYTTRELGLFTESYGGHYGPEFASFILEQNEKIDAGEVEGEHVELVALGINNGWIAPKMQFKSYATYARDNPYKQILDDKETQWFLKMFEELCVPAIDNCTTMVGDDEACARADDVCNTQMYVNLEYRTKANFNVYDVRIGRDAVDPPDLYLDYITRKDVVKAIGARSSFSMCDQKVYNDMSTTGDDWICNWEGNFWAVNTMDWYGRDDFATLKLANYTVDGKNHGEYKTLHNLSWLKVFEAGHEVPYYQPEAALQVFKQTMQRKPLAPT